MVFANMKRWGAPLVRDCETAKSLSLEETLARGLNLARQHPEVAKVWPVVLAKHRDRVDLMKLRQFAGQLGQKKALGFFLALCGNLMNDSTLAAFSARVRDRRFRKMEDFFLLNRGERARRLADQNTPKLARAWLFRINMSLESFRTCLQKHAGSRVDQG